MASSSVNLEEIPSKSLMNELLRRMKCAPKPEKRLILIGAPGSGKGTQSSIIKDEHYLCPLATGDLLRAAVFAKTPLGIKAKEAMDKGELVSDDLVVGIIDEAMKKPSSSLIAASTKGAAIFSGADRSVTEQMYEYGKNLGLSFQVVDDILDFTQSAEQLGKPVGSDLAKGNLTAQVINMA